MKPTYSLRRRLILLFGAVLFVTLIIITLSVVVLVMTSEREVWLGRQSEAAQNAVAQVTNYIDRARIAVQFIAQERDPARLKAVLDFTLARNPGYLEIVVVDRQGTIVHAQARDEVVLANLFTIFQSSWFQSALNANDEYVHLGSVQISAQNMPYVIMAAPSRMGGVVALRLSLDTLRNIVANIRFGNTGTTYVVQSGAM